MHTVKYFKKLILLSKKEQKTDSLMENKIIVIFMNSRNNYGSRKIKIELNRSGFIASKRKISKIMKKYNLIPNYTTKQFKVHKAPCNNEKIVNLVERKFDNRQHLDVIVSDLTYVKVKDKWNYVCLIIYLFNREIVGYSAGKNKNAELVYQAFLNSKIDLSKVRIFRVDRGNEFKNSLIEKLLKTINIKRSLSKSGCPYDNSVAEPTFKIFKTEFAFKQDFYGFNQLKPYLADYVNWFNNFRIHSALGFLYPFDFKNSLAK